MSAITGTGTWLALLAALTGATAGCGRSGLDLPLDADPRGTGGETAASSGGDHDASNAAGPSGSGGAGTTGPTGSGGEAGGTSGAGGAVTSGSGGDGPGPPDPLACFACVTQNCPEVLDCIQDPACGQGLACLVIECGVGGNPDLECVAGCFDGDIGAALEAIQVLGCVVGTCGEDCASLIPGG